MGTSLQTILSHNGHEITGDADGLVSLTAIWRAAGSPDSKRPNDWARQAGKGFIEHIASSSNAMKSRIYRAGRGRGGETRAHWQIGIAYAKDLSHEIHEAVNEGFRRWYEEEKNPELKINRALDRWKQIGRDEEWVGTRLKGLLQRRSFTSTLADHNCRERSSFKTITNTGNLACLGKTAREIKAAKGLPKSAPTRDHMEKHELAALCFFEAMTEKRIKDVAADGDDECIAAAHVVGKAVKAAIQAVDQTCLPSHAA